MSDTHPGVYEYEQVAAALSGCAECRRLRRALTELNGIIEEQDAQIAEARKVACQLLEVEPGCNYDLQLQRRLRRTYAWLNESQAAEDEGQPPPVSHAE